MKLGSVPLGSDKEIGPLGFLAEPEYYRGFLSQKGVAESPVAVEIRRLTGGPLNTSELRKLKLEFTERLPLELIAQIYDLRKPLSSLFKKTANPEGYYRRKFETMNLWERLGVVTPKPFHIEVTKQSNGNGEQPPIVTILTEYWPGPTHDLNIIAIQERKNSLTGNVEGRFLSAGERKIRESELRDLEIKEREVFSSILDTMAYLAVIGTNHFKDKEMKQERGTFQEVEQGLPERLKEGMLWHLIQGGGVKIEEYRRNKVRERIETCIQKGIQKVMESALPLAKPINERSEWVYVQGDEYLHHFMYTPRGGIVQSGVIDTDSATFSRIEQSAARLVTTPLANLSYETQLSLVKGFFEREEEIAKGRGLQIPPRKPIEDRLKDFDEIAIVQYLLFIGKKAIDILREPEYYTRFIERTVPYDSPQTGIRHTQVPYSHYGSVHMIPRAETSLQERLEHIIEGDTPYKVDTELRGRAQQIIDYIKRITEVSKGNMGQGNIFK